MGIKGALTILKKECEFLGLTMPALFVMIKRNPYAFPNTTIAAYKRYTNSITVESVNEGQI